MFDAITFPDRLTVAVPAQLAEAVRTVAAARGLTGADYVRGAVQARLMLDGAKFDRLPDLKRVATRRGPSRAF
ncbi:hypothetical protein [Methylobacterium sp. 391_Methyba4]|uniref:hypothetical protein n=1 Tax=Methylobacterium sp. 391_Methyba4 TaxID=3038924 RepID=UPI00241F8D42|nr:hypothetical protein [Methylobacterium sp. 391_Methyba4]WFS06251.1 hypothetical protein P9K36_23040 [Methylobacterium sp. 391_Methyba4]